MSTSALRVLALSLTLALTLPLRAQPADPIVRVFVLSRVAPQSITVNATDGPLAVYANRDNVPVHTLLPGETVTMTRVGDRIRIATPSGASQASVGEIVPTSGSVLTLRTGSHRRVYHGALSVEIDSERRAMKLINYVPLEEYVASVVATEYPFTEIEGVKAQAVLARTYALRARGKHDFFDLWDDTRSQVYQGEEKATPLTHAAAEATRGQILAYNGEPIEALYSSSSGGHTANNEAIWGSDPVPYLRGRPDPYDDAAPDHRWSTSAPASELLRALGRRFGGTVSGFEITRRSPSGRVQSVRLLGSRPQTISGSRFRSVVTATFGSRTLRSTHFSGERRGNRYVFDGRGFGHGVGMSQFGARAQARQGRTYDAILSFYFAGTNIEHHGMDRPATSDIAANTSRRTRPTPRAEARATQQTRPTYTPPASGATPSTHEQPARVGGTLWGLGAETTARSRRTAW